MNLPLLNIWIYLLIKHTYGYIRIVVICRPPPSKYNRLKIKTFFDDFSTLMEQLATAPGSLLIVGDFNFHLDICNNPDTSKLHHVLESFNLKQHVAVPTHNKGHTLDVIITRSDDVLVEDIMVRDPVLSNHLAMHYKLTLKKPPVNQQKIRYRKLRSIDMKNLCNDLMKSGFIHESNNIIVLSALVDKYESELTEVLDINAPEKRRMITLH